MKSITYLLTACLSFTNIVLINTAQANTKNIMAEASIPGESRVYIENNNDSHILAGEIIKPDKKYSFSNKNILSDLDNIKQVSLNTINKSHYQLDIPYPRDNYSFEIMFNDNRWHINNAFQEMRLVQDSTAEQVVTSLVLKQNKNYLSKLNINKATLDDIYNDSTMDLKYEIDTPVTSDGAEVYPLPDKKSSVIITLPKGDMVKVKQYKNGYLLILYNKNTDKKQGWIRLYNIL